jgi:hypothetical protein
MLAGLGIGGTCSANVYSLKMVGSKKRETFCAEGAYQLPEALGAAVGV